MLEQARRILSADLTHELPHTGVWDSMRQAGRWGDSLTRSGRTLTSYSWGFYEWWVDEIGFKNGEKLFRKQHASSGTHRKTRCPKKRNKNQQLKKKSAKPDRKKIRQTSNLTKKMRDVCTGMACRGYTWRRGAPCHKHKYEPRMWNNAYF